MDSCSLGVPQQQHHERAELLQAFYAIPSIDKAWARPSQRGSGMDVVVAMSRKDLPANATRTYMSYLYLADDNAKEGGAGAHWSPFPFELSAPALVVPSPSRNKVLVVYNAEAGEKKEGSCSARLQIWGSLQLLKEIHVSAKVHGSVYADGQFEGVSWNQEETQVAYVAEEPAPSRPMFGRLRPEEPNDGNDVGTWKGQGDWTEDWGEGYTGKRRPTIFVAELNSGLVKAVGGISEDISAGQVIWAPRRSADDAQYLVFVAWEAQSTNFKSSKKLGIRYCENRPCSLYAVQAPKMLDSDSSSASLKPVLLTSGISSAQSPRFSPDGKSLVFLSAMVAVASGVHCATKSLHSIPWNGVPDAQAQIRDIVPVVMRPDETGFPGLYCSSLLQDPWLQDNCTLVLSSGWRSTQVILSINTENGKVCRISPTDPCTSWNILATHKNTLLAVASSPGGPPSLKVAYDSEGKFQWAEIPMAVKHAEEVQEALAKISTRLLQIPVPSEEDDSSLPEGARQPFEAFLVSPSVQGTEPPPLVVVLHGGPHSAASVGFSRTAAFLSALGFSLLYVNYRGSTGFGEEALQCLPGHVGRRDVGDVVAALDFVLAEGLARPEKVAVLGGSHGGFLASHFIGQAPDRCVTAVMRNPVCSISCMVGTSDIPDWCFKETYGDQGQALYSDAPSLEHLEAFHRASPIAHLHKVKVPTLFLLGAQDRRVPLSTGLQYAQALRSRGLEAKVILFPDDNHALDRPQSDFESFVTIGSWLQRFLC